jgi:putative membrane protein
MISERRLHVAAAFGHALRALRELAFPILIGVVVGGRGTGGMSLLFGVGGVVASALIGWLRWRATRYRVSGGALHVRSGVFSPDDTVVPLDRIQSVDTIEGPVQRLFGITGLHVQTPGGGESAEVELPALSATAVRELRAALGHPEVADAGAPRERLGLGALVLSALTAPQLTVLLPLVGLVGGALQDGVVGVDAGRRLASRLDDPGHALLAVGLVVAAAWVLSFAGALVTFGGFEVTRAGDRLRIRRGLLARRAVSVPVARVDGVVLVESLLRRPLGRVTLRLEVAGLGPEAVAARTLFPLLRRRDAEAFLTRVVPELAVELTLTDRPPRRALRRFVTVPALVAAALAAALIAAVPAAWPAAPVLVAVALAAGADAHAAAGLRLAGSHVVLRTWRRGARVTLAARVRRLQEHGCTRTPLQARAGLATVQVAVGSGTRVRTRHLELPVARAFLAALAP